MSLLDKDREVLAPIFACRVAVAKMTEEEATEEALRERKKTIRWVASKSKDEGSFEWFCDYFDYEPSAVRKAIDERRK